MNVSPGHKNSVYSHLVWWDQSTAGMSQTLGTINVNACPHRLDEEVQVTLCRMTASKDYKH